MSVTWLPDRLSGVRAASRRTRLVGAAVLLAVLAGVAGLGAWAWFGGHLDTGRIVVTGTERVPAAQVRDIAAVTLGTPLPVVDVAAVTAAVGELPLVLRVDVERRWPRTLEVVVTERVAVAAVPAEAGGFDVVDAEGVVMSTGPEPPAALPVLRVDVERDGADTLAAARAVLASLPPDLRARSSELSATSPADVRLVVDGRQVRWGTAANGERKAQVLQNLMASVPGSQYDVSAPGAPAVVP